MVLGLGDSFLEGEKGTAGGDGRMAKAENGGVDVFFAEEFDEGVDVAGAFAAADEGIALDVFAFASGGENGVEEAGGMGGGGLFVVFGETDGDGGLVDHALLEVVSAAGAYVVGGRGRGRGRRRGGQVGSWSVYRGGFG